MSTTWPQAAVRDVGLNANATSITSQALRIRNNVGALRVRLTVRGMSFGEAYFGAAGTEPRQPDDDIVLTMCNVDGGDGLGRDEGGTIDGGVGSRAPSRSSCTGARSVAARKRHRRLGWLGRPWRYGSGSDARERPSKAAWRRRRLQQLCLCEDGGGSGGHGILVGSRARAP
jgi:hypothetical protein